MISSEVQRTLVKSPPELWAELSDPAALARHLGEFGEIRIVRTQGEKLVEWASEEMTGTVLIKPSGWGTKVTLRASRETPVVEPTLETDDRLAAADEAAEAIAVAEQAPEDTDHDGARAQDEAEAPEPRLRSSEPARPDGEQPAQSDDEAAHMAALDRADEANDIDDAARPPEQEVVSEPRRGFFARLFGRRRKQPSTATVAADRDHAAATPSDADAQPPQSSDEQHDVRAQSDDAIEQNKREADVETSQAAGTLEQDDADAEPANDLLEPAHDAEPAASTADEDRAPSDVSLPTVELSRELLALETVAAEHVQAVLTAALDRLGAAHHRPFSRA